MVTPTDWQEVRLGDCASFLKGSGLAKSDLIEGGAERCIHYGELFTHYGPVIEEVTSRCGSVAAGCRSVRGDVLMPGSDVTPRGLATASAVMVDGVVLGGDVIVIRPARHSLWGPYLANVIRFNKGSVLRLVKGSTVYHIHAKDLSGLTILLPSLKEQEAIAEALSDADSAIEALDALIAKKQDVKQAAMQQLLTGRTRLPGFSEVWLDTTIGGVAQAISGGTPSTAIAAYWDGGIPWCTPTDITATRGRYLKSTERTITQLGISSSGASLLPAGALLLCTRATIGEVRIAAQPTATNQGFKSLVVRPGTSNIFLYYLLSTLRPKFIERASGSTFLEIGRGDLVSVDIRIAQENEQAAIAEVLSDMDADLEALVAERDKMRLVKQGMMQELLSGRVRLV